MLAVHGPHDCVLVNEAESIDDWVIVIYHSRRDHAPELKFTNLCVAVAAEPDARSVLAVRYDRVHVVDGSEILAGPFQRRQLLVSRVSCVETPTYPLPYQKVGRDRSQLVKDGLRRCLLDPSFYFAEILKLLLGSVCVA